MIETIIAAAALWATPAFVSPTFVGGVPRLVTPRVHELAFTYMTADEMRSKVASLTGFDHAAFELYADVLGRYDPVTGLRTNDRPTLISVLFIQKVAGQVADAVLERELFLDDEERIVFRGIDLAASPDDDAMVAFLASLHGAWLGLPLSSTTANALAAAFRESEGASGTAAAYRGVVASLLEHGGLYYY